MTLADYNATVWEPTLPEKGIPLKIPVKTPGSEFETRSRVVLTYQLNADDSQISTGPVNLEVKILDRLANFDSSTNATFVDGLRLKLTISSEFGLFSGHDEQKIMERVQAQISGYLREKERLQGQLPTDQSSLASRVWGWLRKDEEQPPEDSEDSAQLTAALKQTKKNQQDYETLLEDRKNNLLRAHEFVTKALKLWSQHHSPELDEMAERLVHKVKLVHLELKVPYIQHLLPTRIGQKVQAGEFEELLAKDLTPIDEVVRAFWQFNPDHNSIELRNHCLAWNVETKLFETQVYVDLPPPSGDIDDLQGSLVLQINEAISGINVGWSDKKRGGIDYSVPINYRTWLILDFNIDFVEVFQKRLFSLNRWLHFEGTVFQPDQLADLRAILSNHGLVVMSEVDRSSDEQPNPQEKKIVKEITAVRQGPYLDVIRVRVTSQIKEGTHTITYNQGQEKLSKSTPLGAVDIELLALIRVKHEAINQLFNLLQMDLEHYFSTSTVRYVKEAG